jgi:hypothetical protein
LLENIGLFVYVKFIVEAYIVARLPIAEVDGFIFDIIPTELPLDLAPLF